MSKSSYSTVTQILTVISVYDSVVSVHVSHIAPFKCLYYHYY